MQHIKKDEYYQFNLQEMQNIAKTVDDGINLMASARTDREGIKSYIKKAIYHSFNTGQYFNPKDKYI